MPRQSSVVRIGEAPVLLRDLREQDGSLAGAETVSPVDELLDVPADVWSTIRVGA